MFIYVFIFLVANFFLTFLFSPQYGVEIYGTKHVLFTIAGRYVMTQEQLFYQVTKFFKYFSVIPLGMIFVLTTDPSEFASSLNGIGVTYKVGMSLSLTLRYFPDVADDYHAIKLAQQARGLDMSRKAKMMDRLKNTSAILAPLLFTTMDRIELISNAMDLRGYGKYRKRTWYAAQAAWQSRLHFGHHVCAGPCDFAVYSFRRQPFVLLQPVYLRRIFRWKSLSR